MLREKVFATSFVVHFLRAFCEMYPLISGQCRFRLDHEKTLLIKICREQCVLWTQNIVFE